MGRLDSEGGPTVEDERERRAFRVLQFQLQYLLYSHQALQQRVEEAEQVSEYFLFSLLLQPFLLCRFISQLELDVWIEISPLTSPCHPH